MNTESVKSRSVDVRFLVCTAVMVVLVGSAMVLALGIVAAGLVE